MVEKEEGRERRRKAKGEGAKGEEGREVEEESARLELIN